MYWITQPLPTPPHPISLFFSHIYNPPVLIIKLLSLSSFCSLLCCHMSPETSQPHFCSFSWFPLSVCWWGCKRDAVRLEEAERTCSFLIACIPYSHASFSDLSLPCGQSVRGFCVISIFLESLHCGSISFSFW